MAVNMTDGGSGYAGVQETQPPGQVPTGRHCIIQTTTQGNLGTCIIVTPGGTQKVLLVGRVFSLGSGGYERSRVVLDAENNVCAYCGASTNQ